MNDPRLERALAGYLYNSESSNAPQAPVPQEIPILVFWAGELN